MGSNKLYDNFMTINGLPPLKNGKAVNSHPFASDKKNSMNNHDKKERPDTNNFAPNERKPISVERDKDVVVQRSEAQIREERLARLQAAQKKIDASKSSNEPNHQRKPIDIERKNTTESQRLDVQLHEERLARLQEAEKMIENSKKNKKSKKR